jgi:hypothetical protein
MWMELLGSNTWCGSLQTKWSGNSVGLAITFQGNSVAEWKTHMFNRIQFSLRLVKNDTNEMLAITCQEFQKCSSAGREWKVRSTSSNTEEAGLEHLTEHVGIGLVSNNNLKCSNYSNVIGILKTD